MPPRSQRGNRSPDFGWKPSTVAEPKRLYRAVDHGTPVRLRQADFAPPSRTGGWGPFAESFLRLNEKALAALDVSASVTPGSPEPTVQLAPGGRAGAVPLRSAQTGEVGAGLVVTPRFGWSGIGQVMAETGWAAAPEFVELPLVPGSAREVPPWVLAGPVLARLAELLHSIGRGYEAREAKLQVPRGRILWTRYVPESLVKGQWHKLPCVFPDLTKDPYLRRAIRWATERVQGDLVAIGGSDPVAQQLSEIANILIGELLDVAPEEPRSGDLERRLKLGPGTDLAVRRGIEALGWVVDERGLGGGRELDGLAWRLPLDQLWERYVEATVRKEVSKEGGEVLVGRLNQTMIPFHWSEPGLRSLGHLVPDIVVRKGRSVRIVDAKYKAHLADLDESGWRAASEELRDAHRADVHQVLAYASFFDAEEITVCLVYPVRRATWEALRAKRQDVWRAEVPTRGRNIRVELRGLPFGSARAA